MKTFSFEQGKAIDANSWHDPAAYEADGNLCIDFSFSISIQNFPFKEVGEFILRSIIEDYAECQFDDLCVTLEDWDFYEVEQKLARNIIFSDKKNKINVFIPLVYLDMKKLVAFANFLIASAPPAKG